MEMADSESSDDASGKSSKQSTDNTRRLKKQLMELQWKLATGKHRSASHRSEAQHSKKRKYKSGLLDELTSSGPLDDVGHPRVIQQIVAQITYRLFPKSQET